MSILPLVPVMNLEAGRGDRSWSDIGMSLSVHRLIQIPFKIERSV